jgi:hypothetical protein
MTDRSLQIARLLVKTLEAEQHQPTLQERLDVIFLAGKANIDAIVADAESKLDGVLLDMQPKYTINMTPSCFRRWPRWYGGVSWTTQ